MALKAVLASQGLRGVTWGYMGISAGLHLPSLAWLKHFRLEALAGRRALQALHLKLDEFQGVCQFRLALADQDRV